MEVVLFHAKCSGKAPLISRDPKEAKGGSPADYREQRIQIVGTVRTKLSRSVLRRTLGKDAEVRGGGVVRF